MKTKVRSFMSVDDMNKFLEKPEVVYHDLSLAMAPFGVLYVLVYKEVVVV